MFRSLPSSKFWLHSGWKLYRFYIQIQVVYPPTPPIHPNRPQPGILCSSNIKWVAANKEYILSCILPQLLKHVLVSLRDGFEHLSTVCVLCVCAHYGYQWVMVRVYFHRPFRSFDKPHTFIQVPHHSQSFSLLGGIFASTAWRTWKLQSTCCSCVRCSLSFLLLLTVIEIVRPLFQFCWPDDIAVFHPILSMCYR